MSDTIHNPAHYTVYPVQPIEISRHLGFCLGNAVKYVLRAPFKGGVEDCEKALKYLDWEGETPQGPALLKTYHAAMEKIDDLIPYLRESSATPWQEQIMEVQADFLEAVSTYLEHQTTGNVLQLRVLAMRIAEVIEKNRCRVCGCTDDHACEGGCFWVEDDLCSACVEPGELAKIAPGVDGEGETQGA